MPELTIHLSTEAHNALEASAASCGRTIDELVEESLAKTGLLRSRPQAVTEWTQAPDEPAASVRHLRRIQQQFELSVTDLGRLFGASHQAVTVWLRNGVPTARKPKVYTVLSIAELLGRKLKPGLLPAVARRSASAYGGISMLQMIETGRHEELLREVRDSFNWAATA